MDLAESQRAVEIYCARRSLDDVQIACSRRGHTITIVERRPPWHPDDTEWSETNVAQLRGSGDHESWTLHCADRNERWRRCDEIPPAPSVAELLMEIDRDPTGIFWG